MYASRKSVLCTVCNILFLHVLKLASDWGTEGHCGICKNVPKFTYGKLHTAEWESYHTQNPAVLFVLIFHILWVTLVVTWSTLVVTLFSPVLDHERQNYNFVMLTLLITVIITFDKDPSQVISSKCGVDLLISSSTTSRPFKKEPKIITRHL